VADDHGLFTTLQSTQMACSSCTLASTLQHCSLLLRGRVTGDLDLAPLVVVCVTTRRLLNIARLSA